MNPGPTYGRPLTRRSSLTSRRARPGEPSSRCGGKPAPIRGTDVPFGDSAAPDYCGEGEFRARTAKLRMAQRRALVRLAQRSPLHRVGGGIDTACAADFIAQLAGVRAASECLADRRTEGLD